ncbi:response regulator [Sinorhizobium medicae]|uniref:response regulator transcription factor n=1 Tax=Sinorhizobium medicae TaxID=110321 RepID=UPI00299DE708|nr:response regulator [Sinorhizobium medicae]MDX0543550.1 response regulator [Sinorhizobium medicae]MDX0802701.1 response regulator [Sinorhizobium medicae]WQO48191.1 response regulator [Sinorhizobium medicae]WQO67896.1 response regulator [Sinorhizobium medicae]WQO74974.1 response regulator [Sinorhizobium medicae]
MRNTPVISIIDDDDSSRIGTASLVRSLGFVAHAFPSARLFLHSEQLTESACLISDVQMPGTSGLQLQDELHARGHDIPFIFITAYADDRIRAQAFARGAVCFLSKPFDGETLSRCLDMALKNHARESE